MQCTAVRSPVNIEDTCTSVAACQILGLVSKTLALLSRRTCQKSRSIGTRLLSTSCCCAQNIVAVHASISFSQTLVTVPTAGQATVTATITQPTGFGVQGAIHHAPRSENIRQRRS